MFDFEIYFSLCSSLTQPSLPALVPVTPVAREIWEEVGRVLIR